MVQINKNNELMNYNFVSASDGQGYTHKVDENGRTHFPSCPELKKPSSIVIDYYKFMKLIGKEYGDIPTIQCSICDRMDCKVKTEQELRDYNDVLNKFIAVVESYTEHLSKIKGVPNYEAYSLVETLLPFLPKNHLFKLKDNIVDVGEIQGISHLGDPTLSDYKVEHSAGFSFLNYVIIHIPVTLGDSKKRVFSYDFQFNYHFDSDGKMLEHLKNCESALDIFHYIKKICKPYRDIVAKQLTYNIQHLCYIHNCEPQEALSPNILGYSSSGLRHVYPGYRFKLEAPLHLLFMKKEPYSLDKSLKFIDNLRNNPPDSKAKRM